ncbi:hypothetical protein ACLOJK_020751 [Asimina triloba]
MRGRRIFIFHPCISRVRSPTSRPVHATTAARSPPSISSGHLPPPMLLWQPNSFACCNSSSIQHVFHAAAYSLLPRTTSLKPFLYSQSLQVQLQSLLSAPRLPSLSLHSLLLLLHMDLEEDSSTDLSPSHHQSNAFSPPDAASSSTATSQKRRAGRKKFRETRHPVYRGVRQRRQDKWVCEVRKPNHKSRIWLGTFPSPEMAARAHDVAAIALRGDAAVLNFPESRWALPRAKSSLPKDIQAAAIEAAKAFRDGSPGRKGSEPTPVVQTAAFVDEEAVFNMPGHLANMAEGLLITPPAMQSGFDWDDVESQVDLSLWHD